MRTEMKRAMLILFIFLCTFFVLQASNKAWERDFGTEVHKKVTESFLVTTQAGQMFTVSATHECGEFLRLTSEAALESHDEFLDADIVGLLHGTIEAGTWLFDQELNNATEPCSIKDLAIQEVYKL